MHKCFCSKYFKFVPEQEGQLERSEMHGQTTQWGYHAEGKMNSVMSWSGPWWALTSMPHTLERIGAFPSLSDTGYGRKKCGMADHLIHPEYILNLICGWYWSECSWKQQLLLHNSIMESPNIVRVRWAVDSNVKHSCMSSTDNPLFIVHTSKLWSSAMLWTRHRSMHWPAWVHGSGMELFHSTKRDGKEVKYEWSLSPRVLLVGMTK